VAGTKGQTQSSGGGSVQVTLTSDAAKELLQALTAALGSGGGGKKGKETATAKSAAAPKAAAKPLAAAKPKAAAKPQAAAKPKASAKA
jgi:hypothetical protein